MEKLPAAISFPFSSSLYLVWQPLRENVNTPPPPAAPALVHHLAVLDVSGSMANDLPAVRRQLKNKLAKLVKAGDLVTLVWFSGKNQYGALVESEPVASLSDLSALHQAIDHWLQPVGMTGFKQPLEKVYEIARDRRRQHADEVFSLFFMSDGCDNQWRAADIMAPLSDLARICSSATFVEYGYYADRKMLAAMAEASGGVHIFAEDFPAYEPLFEKSLTKLTPADQKITIRIDGQPTSDQDIAFAFSQGDLFSFSITGNANLHVALVSDSHDGIYYFSKTPVGNVAYLAHQPGLYAAISLYALRMRSDLIYQCLKVLGDVALIDEFASCFGKQKYTTFMQRAARCVFDLSFRFTKGCDYNHLPPDDAFTIFDLLQRLNQTDSSRLLLEHPAFRYSRISRSKITVFAEFAAIEQEISAINDHLAMAKDAGADIKLRYTIAPTPGGYPIQDLVYNEERPNISLRVKKDILIDLAPAIAQVEDDNLRAELVAAKLPDPFPSYIWRNYTIVKDGMLNVSMLPISISSPSVLQSILTAMHPDSDITNASTTSPIVFDLDRLAILNRNMVKAPSALSMLQLEWKLTKLRAQQKVFNHFQKELVPKISTGYALVYGEEIATFLQSHGITDYNGFSPKQILSPPTDAYYSKTLAVSLKGYASLPTVKEVQERMAKAGGAKGQALTGCAGLMAPVIAVVQDKLAAGTKPALAAAWLEGMQKAAVAETRMALMEKAKLVFAIVVGQVWFKEWASLEENKMTVNFDGMGKPTEGKIEMVEEEIQI